MPKGRIFHIVPFSSGHYKMNFPDKGGEESVFYVGGVKVIDALVSFSVKEI